MDFPPPNMPPPNFQPPPNFHPRPNFHQNHNNFHHKPFYKSYKHGGMQVQDDFDGKRLRKSVMRKTVDYNSSIIKALEVRQLIIIFSLKILWHIFFFIFRIAFGNATIATEELSSLRTVTFPIWCHRRATWTTQATQLRRVSSKPPPTRCAALFSRLHGHRKAVAWSPEPVPVNLLFGMVWRLTSKPFCKWV